MDLRIEKLEKQHLEDLEVTPFGTSVYDTFLSVPDENIRDLDHAFAILDDVGVVACSGIIYFWEGRSEVWTIISKRVPGNIALQKALKRVLNHHIEEYGGHRVEAVIDSDCKVSHKWIKSLGFKMETPLMRGYLGKGKDCSMYVRLGG